MGEVDTYSKFGMPILGALLALMIRSIVLQIMARRRSKAEPPRPSSSTVPVSTTTPTPAEVN
jgi:hypothetical protein